MSADRSNRHPRYKGPITESDFFTWEALISGPKDTPFVSDTSSCARTFTEYVNQEGGIFAAKLTFVSFKWTATRNYHY